MLIHASVTDGLMGGATKKTQLSEWWETEAEFVGRCGVELSTERRILVECGIA